MTRFRRNHPRIDDPSLLAVLPHGRGRAEAKVRDISVSGAALVTDATLPVGAVIDLELREAAAGEAKPLSVRARVTRLIGPPDSGMAVEFVERRPGDTFRLLDFVDRYGWRRRGSSVADEQPAAALRPAAVDTPPATEPTDSETDRGAGSAAQPPRLETALAQAHAATARAEALETRLHALEEQLAAARRELVALRHPEAAELKEEAREVTLGPDSVRTVDDFTDRLKRGARLRLTERFRTLQPVSRVDFQLADWLRTADRLDDLTVPARQLGGTDQLAAEIYRFFERGLVRITR